MFCAFCNKNAQVETAGGPYQGEGTTDLSTRCAQTETLFNLDYFVLLNDYISEYIVVVG